MYKLLQVLFLHLHMYFCVLLFNWHSSWKDAAIVKICETFRNFFVPFDASRIYEQPSDEEEGKDSDYDDRFCDEDDWFSPIGENQAKSTNRNETKASGFSRSEENVEASEYVLSAADDSFNQEPVGDMDAGWHEQLQAQSDLQFTSSTSTPYQASEHSQIVQE